MALTGLAVLAFQAGGHWSHEDDVYGTVGGRIYSTALAVLTLQSYYRFVTKQVRIARPIVRWIIKFAAHAACRCGWGSGRGRDAP